MALSLTKSLLESASGQGVLSLQINSERLWSRLMEMAQIGATAKGGVCRVALTDEDRAGRDLFIEWCQAAGCVITIDQLGNLYACREGMQNDLPPVVACSHLDTVPTGGKFDGALGILAGLEVLETLNDYNLTTTVPLEVISWTNEEGARFVPAMLASGVFAGVFAQEYALSRTDKDGHTVSEELQRIGYAGNTPVGNHPIQAAFELHIEQGPVLEMQDRVIGVVTGVQGMRWYNMVIQGQEAHAGPTPMPYRRDPVQGMIPILRRIFGLATKYAPHARATIGSLQAEPGIINTVPGRLTVTVDLRHPEATILAAMDMALKEIVQEECVSSGLESTVEDIWHSPPVVFADECVKSIRNAVAAMRIPSMDIYSGAGHDAVYVSRVAPTGMIFIPCKNGLSHNELESAKPEDVAAGANVLLRAMLEQADQPSFPPT